MAFNTSYIFNNEWCHADSPSTNAPLPPATQAVSGSGRTSIAKGFPEETAEPITSSGIPPYRLDFNGVLRQITANLVWFARGGMFPWDSTIAYQTPAVVSYTVSSKTCAYMCIKDAPAGTSPTNTTYWKRILNNDDIADLQTAYLPLSAGASHPLTGALYGTQANFQYVTCNGTAGTGGIGFVGKASTSGTADKTVASITFKNRYGTDVSFNGSTGVDLRGGVAYAETAGNVIGVTGLIGYFACDRGRQPSGWLVCDGSQVSRSTYASLYAQIGTKWGAGDGSSTFNLPNLVGRFPEGATSSIGAYVEAGLPNITGTSVGEHGIGYWAGVNTGAFFDKNESMTHPGVGDTDNDNVRTGFDASRCSPVYGRSTTVQPASAKLLPCIHI